MSTSAHRLKLLRSPSAYCLWVVTSTACISFTAFAATESRDSRTLEEVVVTAQKREQALQDVPMSISAVAAEDLREARINTALDLSFAVPSLAVAETGPGRQIIGIRGLASERGSSSLTALYLDEAPLSGAQDGFVQSYMDVRSIDLERIEVLRGPQGTLFGEGAVGGAIRYITRAPVLNRVEGELTTSASGTEDGGASGSVVGVLNLPFAQDAFAVRIAATYENNSGWIDQPSTNRKDINDNELVHVRARGLWQPTPELQVNVTIVDHENDGGASNVVNQELSESNFLQAADRNAPTDFQDEYQIYNLTITYDLGFANLLSSTSTIESDSQQSFTQLTGTLPTPTLEILMRDYTQASEMTSQELRLTSNRQSSLEWTIGGFFKDAEIRRSFASGQDFNVFIDGSPFSGAGFDAGSTPVATSESWAAFADISHHLTDQLTLGAGVRYFEDKRESFDATNRLATYLSGNFNATTYRAFAAYKLTDNINVYATIGDGFRSGGFNEPGSVLLGAPGTFDPEFLSSYEIGLKSFLFNRRVRFDIAAFRSEYEDMQDDVSIVSPIDGTTPIQFTANEQQAELSGFEMETSWIVFDGLTLTFAGALIDSEITDVSSASAFDTGDPLNNAPDYNYRASADYSFQWAPWAVGHARIDYSGQGETTGTLRRSPFIDPPQYTTAPATFLNASLSVGTDNGWYVTLFGRNLADERGAIRASATGATAQARPRTIGISLGRQF